MTQNIIRVLLIEDSPSDARLIRDDLNGADGKCCNVTIANCMADGLAQLRSANFDVALTDLGLPDSTGFSTFKLIQEEFPFLPIVVLTGTENPASGVEAIRNGVQDFLSKDNINGKTITRAIRYAIERKGMEEKLKKTTRRFELLSKIAGKLLLGENPQNFMNSLCQTVMEELDCQTFFNFLVDEKKGLLHLNAFAGISDDVARKIEWLEFGVAICGCVARDGRRIVAENVQTTLDPRTDLIRGFGIRAYACHPILFQGRVAGTLSFGAGKRDNFTEDDLALMKTVVDQVSISLERVRSEERVRDLNSTLEIRVRERTIQLVRLTHELIRTEQRERKRLASLLHDHLQQLLVAAQLFNRAARKDVKEQEPKELLERVSGLLDESIIASKSLTFELYPPILQEAGLVAAMTWLANWMSEKHGLIVEIQADSEIEPDKEGMCIFLFQAVRELLFNVVKHSGTKNASISISRMKENSVLIVVSDRGIGFGPTASSINWGSAGFGLFSIRERLNLLGGCIEVESAPGNGTRVSLFTPFKDFEDSPAPEEIMRKGGEAPV